MCVDPSLANNDQVTYINVVRVDIMCVSVLAWQTMTKLLTSMWLELITSMTKLLTSIWLELI